MVVTATGPKDNVSKKEQKRRAAMSKPYLTFWGYMNLIQMISKFGNPKVRLNVSTFQAVNGRTGKLITVERTLSVDLVFDKKLEVRGLSKEFCLSLDNSGIYEEPIRYPNYNTANPPAANRSEILKYEKEMARSQEGEEMQ